MRKERNTQTQAWVFSMAGLISGACAVLLRWLQIEIIYDAETRLPQTGAMISSIMMLWMVAAPVILWLLAGKMPVAGTSLEPEEALAVPGKELLWILTLLTAGAGLGSLLLLFRGSTKTEYIVAMLSLLSLPAMVAMPFLPRWGSFGAILSVLPVLFFSFWLVTYYKNNAVNPVVWDYGTQILAIAGCLYASFRLCGYLFYRIEPRKTLFGCGVALTYCLMILTDKCSLAMRVILPCWGVFFGVMGWVIVNNLAPPNTEPEKDY